MKPDAAKGGLASLFPSIGAEGFRQRYWPHTPHVEHGSVERLSALAQIPELHELDRLVHAYRERIPVWFPNAMASVGLKRAHGVRLEPADALVFYESGATLFFEHVDRWVPALRPLVRRIEWELELHPGSVYCSLFASPGHGGSPAHFDPDLNLSVQLRGHKTWRLAPNEHVAEPMQGYSVADGGQPSSHLLASYCRLPLPEEMPAARTFEVTLQPGSVLFMPRGYWHSTEVADEESVALVFAILPKTWLQVALGELQHALMTDERWRRYALGVGGPGQGRAAAETALAELLSGLPAQIAALSAGPMVSRLARANARFRLDPACRAVLEERSAAGGSSLVLCISGASQEHEIWLSPRHRELAAWILDRKSEFSLAEAFVHAGELDDDDAVMVLDNLVDVGLLTGEETSHE